MNWGFIGCGNLAQAIIQGALEKNLLDSQNIFVTNRSDQKLKELCAKTGVRACATNEELIRSSDVVVLATKPQDLQTVLEEIQPFIRFDQAVISLAAGIPTKTLNRYLKARSLVRVMANTAAKVQQGVFGIYFFRETQADRAAIEHLFGQLGTLVQASSDRQIDAMTAGSASGSGFVIFFLEEFEKWFRRKGFDSQQARMIAIETFLGTLALTHHEKQKSLKELRQAITSKKGTTYAGLHTLKKKKVDSGIQKSLDAAFNRCAEISKLLK